MTNEPPRADRWRGPTFDVTVVGRVPCPACGKDLRATGVTQSDDETRWSCLACHAVPLQIEQHRPGGETAI